MKMKPNLTEATMDHYDEEGELLYSTPLFKTPYNHDRMAESNRTGLSTKDPSLTDQSFKEDADINVIMERVMKTKEIPLALPEHFGDATQIPTLFDARMRIAESNATFYKLPAKIREEFLNDPGRWEAQVVKDLNDANVENLKRMGINTDDIHVIAQVAPKVPQPATPAAGTPDNPAPAGTSKSP